jgi:hypothetical protein
MNLNESVRPQCHGNTKELRPKEDSESDSKSDGGSHSSHIRSA